MNLSNKNEICVNGDYNFKGMEYNNTTCQASFRDDNVSLDIALFCCIIIIIAVIVTLHNTFCLFITNHRYCFMNANHDA